MREKAFNILKKYLKNQNLIKHSIASAYIMEALAEKLGEDKDLWFTLGLLHDIDYEMYGDDPSKHTIVGADILKKEGFDDEFIRIVKSHNELSGTPREKDVDFALSCAETITGLIVAATLVLPSKKIKDLKLKSLKKRFKEKRFAAGANRENIKLCEKLGLSLDEFLELALEVMKRISSEIGL